MSTDRRQPLRAPLHRCAATLAALILGMPGASAQAVSIDLGGASGYSGFFFGNVEAAADVEGRLAVGGNLQSGFDVGYRIPYGSSARALVVGGNLTWHGGELYAGPSYATDTNASIGPAAAQWLSEFDPLTGRFKVNPGTGVYGGTADFGGYWNTAAFSQQSGVVDFAGTQAQLAALSSQLDSLSPTGAVVANGSGGLNLVGDGVSLLQVFNLGTHDLANLTLANVPAGAHIVINSERSDVAFSGFMGSQTASVTDLSDLGAFRDRLVFNLRDATEVNINTGVSGLVLALQARVMGSGHLEGSLIAQSLQRRSSDNGVLEIGYEPFVTYTATGGGTASAVPEPDSLVLLLSGLVVTAALSRRRRAAAARAALAEG